MGECLSHWWSRFTAEWVSWSWSCSRVTRRLQLRVSIGPQLPRFICWFQATSKGGENVSSRVSFPQVHRKSPLVPMGLALSLHPSGVGYGQETEQSNGPSCPTAAARECQALTGSGTGHLLGSAAPVVLGLSLQGRLPKEDQVCKAGQGEGVLGAHCVLPGEVRCLHRALREVFCFKPLGSWTVCLFLWIVTKNKKRTKPEEVLEPVSSWVSSLHHVICSLYWACTRVGRTLASVGHQLPSWAAPLSVPSFVGGSEPQWLPPRASCWVLSYLPLTGSVSLAKLLKLSVACFSCVCIYMYTHTQN